MFSIERQPQLTLKFAPTIPDELFVAQDHWIRNHTSQHFYPSLERYLSLFNLQKYYNVIVNQIEGPLFQQARGDTHGIEGWSVEDVATWVKSLHFLHHDNGILSNEFRAQWVDGSGFMRLVESDCRRINMSRMQFILLSAIRSGLMGDWTPTPRLSTHTTSPLLNNHPDVMNELYGQLVVIGAKEARLEGKQGEYWSLGLCNETFLLKKRSQANCIKHNATATQSTDNPEPTATRATYIIDSSKDMFQIGRCESSGMNDFIVHGAMHYDAKSKAISSPTSRYACRIECNRNPPYDCRLLASGFSDTQTLFHGDKYINLSVQGQDWQGQYDELTTFGVKLWNPDLHQWCEISVQGSCYSTRLSQARSGVQLGSEYTNELKDGSIIDIHGVLLYFQKPYRIRQRWSMNPNSFLGELNALKIQCPVMMHTLTFSYSDRHERQRREHGRLLDSHMGYTSTPAIHIPRTDYADVEENSRTYVFPACGHVHGYHQSLVGKPCPLCRQPGDFVPLAFEFDSPFCAGKPTFLFNPCGHAASRDLCEEFASIPTFVYDIHGNVIDHRARCPYCCIELHDDHHGGPFNRLIVQPESGAQWESESERSDSDVEVMMINQLANTTGGANVHLIIDNSDNIDGSSKDEITCHIPMSRR